MPAPASDATHPPRQSWRLRALLSASIALIAFATLTPQPAPARPMPRLCLVCGDVGMVDVIGNVVLFAPLGAALRLLGSTPLGALGLGALVSVLVELAQLLVIPGRHASAGDLVMNLTGAFAGAMAVGSWRTVVLSSPAGAARLARGAVLLLLAVHGIAAFAFARHVPHTAYWGQWGPTRTAETTFPGTVLGFSVGGMEIPWGVVSPARAAWPLLESDTARFRVAFLTDTTPPRPAPIVRLVHPDFELFQLAQDGATDLQTRVRTRAATLRLRVPILAIPGALDPSARGRDTVRVEAWRSGTALEARWTRGGARGSASLPLTTSLGWVLLLPFATPLGPWAVAVSAVWNAALALPIAWWGARAAGARRGAVLALGASVIALLVVPLVTGGAHARPLEWLGACAGAALGAWLAHAHACSRRVRAQPYGP